VVWVTFLTNFLCFNSDDLDSESIYGHLEEPLEINPTEDDPEAGMSDMQGFKITMLLYWL